jgi:hypothetical protein
MVHHHHGRRQSRLFNLMLLNGELLLAESLSRDLCGSAHGGPRDLAANKKHLADYGSWKR